MSEEDLRRDGPGAATAANEIPLIEVEHTGHTLEPEWKRLPIGPDHILYPVLIGIGLFPILMGASGHHLADDMPDDETHPFFPDHFWPYPVIIVVMMVTLGEIIVRSPMVMPPRSRNEHAWPTEVRSPSSIPADTANPK